MPFGLVAADGPDERRYEPEGGLSIEEWPYLKECCGLKNDEEFVQIWRDENVGAILTNQLQKKGHSFGAARGAVNELMCECDDAGCEKPLDGDGVAGR